MQPRRLVVTFVRHTDSWPLHCHLRVVPGWHFLIHRVSDLSRVFGPFLGRGGEHPKKSTFMCQRLQPTLGLSHRPPTEETPQENEQNQSSTTDRALDNLLERDPSP